MPVKADPRRIRRGHSHCIFSRAGRDFAVPVGVSAQVISGGVARPTPGAPPHFAGTLETERGVVPLIRIEALLGAAGQPYEIGSHVLLVEANQFRIGIVVDRVREVRAIDPAEIASAAEMEGNPLVRGVWQGPAREAIIVDGERLVSEALAARDEIPDWVAAPKEDPRRRQTSGTEEFCVFARGEIDLALPIAAAREVLTGESVTPVPQSPAQLIGVLNLRGEILPLVQIDGWLGLSQKSLSLDDQIVVVESQGILVGIIVDRVRDVRSLELREIGRYSGPGEENPIFRGLWQSGGQKIAIVDSERLVHAAVEAVTNGFRRALVAPKIAGGGAAVGVANTV